MIDQPCGATQGARGATHRIIALKATPLAVSPLTDHPTIEAKALRGLWFAVLIATPFWLTLGALDAWMIR